MRGFAVLLCVLWAIFVFSHSVDKIVIDATIAALDAPGRFAEEFQVLRGESLVPSMTKGDLAIDRYAYFIAGLVIMYCYVKVSALDKRLTKVLAIIVTAACIVMWVLLDRLLSILSSYGHSDYLEAEQLIYAQTWLLLNVCIFLILKLRTGQLASSDEEKVVLASGAPNGDPA